MRDLTVTCLAPAGALRHAIVPAWGEEVAKPKAMRAGWTEAGLVFGGLVALLLLGVWLPGPLRAALESAASIVGGAP